MRLRARHVPVDFWTVSTYRQTSPANRRDFEDAIGIVINRTEQLGGFMQRFADVFRMPLPRPCDLVAILENIVRLLSARPDAAGITWRWELDEPSVRVAIARGQMEQALLNVLKNACRRLSSLATSFTA